MKYFKPFEELTFHDDFMFGLVMQDKDLCRDALECLLGIKISHVEYSEPQKTIAPLYTAHGIRLDIYVQDGNTVYDVEIQNKDEKDMGRRTRYYQSMMDVDSLLKGQDYSDLRHSVIIFLCRFDPFKKQIPCYNIARTCREDRSVELDDAAEVHIFNCTAYKDVENPSLRAFLKFVQNNKAESDLTRRIDRMVETQKTIEANKKMYLTWSLHDHDVRNEGIRIGEKRGEKKGIAIGRSEGQELAKIENARKMLVRNYPLTEIADITGLPIEKIEELAKRD